MNDNNVTVLHVPEHDIEVEHLETMLAVARAFPDVPAITVMQGLAALRKAGFDVVRVAS